MTAKAKGRSQGVRDRDGVTDRETETGSQTESEAEMEAKAKAGTHSGSQEINIGMVESHIITQKWMHTEERKQRKERKRRTINQTCTETLTYVLQRFNCKLEMKQGIKH